MHPYVDSVGKTTIGIGRNLNDVGITQAEAIYLCSNDIQNATQHLEQSLPWTSSLDDVRRDALIAMTFNMGIGRLCGFKKFLSALQAGDWKTARNEMLDSQWASQVGARAYRLAIQIETGFYQ